MVEATPNTPSAVVTQPTSDIKIPTKDLILYNDETTPVELMVDLIFEDIGAQEMINITRNDIINGQHVVYQPISNLSSIYFQYNPQNILSLQSTSEEYFKKFPIRIENMIPTVGTGPNGETIYIDQTTGDLIINVINLESDQQVEVQIMSNGTIFDDTIYGVNN